MTPDALAVAERIVAELRRWGAIGTGWLGTTGEDDIVALIARHLERDLGEQEWYAQFKLAEHELKVARDQRDATWTTARAIVQAWRNTSVAGAPTAVADVCDEILRRFDAAQREGTDAG